MKPPAKLTGTMTFSEELALQRWDDHRLYHQSRVNQALHLFSACSFLAMYALIPFHPALAAILGWIVSMWSRQIGHFFFEPRGFDQVNQLSFQAKEDVKVGFNLQRKVVLLAAWLAVPALFAWQPTLFGALSPVEGAWAWLDRVGTVWLWLGLAGLLARTGYLMATRNVQTGAVWFTKILTDPFHDIAIYHRAPLHLLRGEWLDPMNHVEARA